MTNQEQNREALIDHIAEQDRIIRRRNEQIAAQVEIIEEVRSDLADYRAMHSVQIKTIARLQEDPRHLTPDAITDEMVERAVDAYLSGYDSAKQAIRAILTAALTEPPTRPEGAEKVEAVLNRYWSGDINGDDLADRIAEEMNR